MALNSSDLLFNLKDVLYGGIRNDVPGHGGQECADYLDRKLMFLDSGIGTFLMILTCYFAFKTYTLPRMNEINTTESKSKRFMVIFVCLVFGIEVGYKLASKQVLYLFNPCHVYTVVEIYLLAAKPSIVSVSVFRVLLHYLYGALIALLLPDTNARMFHGEIILYWIQHIMIFFVVPPYIVYQWGIKSIEPLSDFAWPCFAGAVMCIHHYYLMQPIAIVSHVNLNFLLCPATKDPFNGPYYRLAALFHQMFCLLTLGKVYHLVLHLIIPKQKNMKKI